MGGDLAERILGLRRGELVLLRTRYGELLEINWWMRVSLLMMHDPGIARARVQVGA